MYRTHIYLPEKLKNDINTAAKTQRKSKAEVIREALEQGLKVTVPQKSNSAQGLLDLANAAKKFNSKGPRDLAINHDHYTWGGPKRDPNAPV